MPNASSDLRKDYVQERPGPNLTMHRSGNSRLRRLLLPGDCGRSVARLRAVGVAVHLVACDP